MAMLENSWVHNGFSDKNFWNLNGIKRKVRIQGSFWESFVDGLFFVFEIILYQVSICCLYICIYVVSFEFFLTIRGFERMKSMQNERVFNADSKYIIGILNAFCNGNVMSALGVRIWLYFPDIDMEIFLWQTRTHLK